MDDCVIRVTGLKKSFPEGKEVLCVLKGIIWRSGRER